MIDLHSHTRASDGELTPTELVALARAQGVTVLAVTDHDTLAGLAEARQAAASAGPPLELISGIELSTGLGRVDLHVLGHFVREEDEALRRYVVRQGGERRRRMEGMIAKLNALGIPVRMAQVEAIAGGESLCRPHLARALVDLGRCRDPQDAFRRFIGDGAPAFVAQERLPAHEAIALLHAAGGTATLAHPGLDRIDRHQIRQLREAGLDGLEVFHADHHPSQREKYLKIATELDLVPTAGSDFHGEGLSPGRKPGDSPLEPRYFEALRARAAPRKPL